MVHFGDDACALKQGTDWSEHNSKPQAKML